MSTRSRTASTRLIAVPSLTWNACARSRHVPLLSSSSSAFALEKGGAILSEPTNESASRRSDLDDWRSAASGRQEEGWSQIKADDIPRSQQRKPAATQSYLTAHVLQ